ncbi:nucleoside hydrolase [uncultured Planktomarina sp.]|uniref:nucleoside hydrolase n=1 Tax=uncultured Planktomarina sp. TaxID=1538529 RepID=UPI0032B2A952
MALKLIIDTDPGIDDAMAILYAIAAPEIDLLGLTTVFGNVTTPKATRNALYLLEQAGIEIPVAEGLHRPRIGPPFPPTSAVHGAEGFGTLAVPTPQRRALVETAPEYLVRMARAHQGELLLCPIGPLTNIAAAMELDPSFCSNLKGMVVMGGSLRAGGNITPAAEANFYHDPHAADFVLRHGCNITLVGLDVTNRVICPRSFFARLASESPKMGGLLHDMAEFYIDFYETVGKFAGCGMHDPSALVACIAPELFTTEPHALRVALSGDRSGEMIAVANSTAQPVNVCTDVQAEAVKQNFFKNVAKLS